MPWSRTRLQRGSKGTVSFGRAGLGTEPPEVDIVMFVLVDEDDDDEDDDDDVPLFVESGRLKVSPRSVPHLVVSV